MPNGKELPLHKAILFYVSIHWSRGSQLPLAIIEPIKAYDIMKMGIRHVNDIVDQQGNVLSFPHACRQHGLGMHYRPLLRQISNLIQPYTPVPPLYGQARPSNWKLLHQISVCRALLAHLLTSIKVYRFILLVPWIDRHANNIWHQIRSLRWWQTKLKDNWKAKLTPTKHLWRCLVGVFLVGVNLAIWKIASLACPGCSSE